MVAKPTYEELELRIDELERKALGRKLSEEALQASAGFLDTLVSSASDGVVVYDDKFRYKLWNKFMEKLTGMQAENVLGKIAFDLFPHLREEGIDKLLERALAGETVQSGDTLYHVPDTGKVGWVTGLYSPHVDPSGNIVGVVAIVHDISDRKRAEDLLRESEERHRLLLEVSPDPIVLYGIEGKTIYVNPAFEQTFGWSLDELREKRIDFVPEENWQETKEAINRMLQGLKIQLFETRRLTKDGRILNIQLSSSLFFDRDEKPAGNIVILRDITAQKRAEETLRKAHDELEQRVKERTAELVVINKKLQESEDRYRLIFDGSRDAIFITDANAKFANVNDAASVLTGYSKAELKRMSIPHLHEKVDLHAYETYFESIMAGEPVVSEAKILRKNGVKVDTEFSNTRIEISGIPFMHTVARDITARKLTEEALRGSEERYRTLAENSMVGFWQITLEGYTTYINPAMCSMIEIESPEELSGQTYHSFFTRKSLETIDRERARRLDGKGACYEVEIVGKRGGRCDVVICGASLLSAEGKLQGYIATFTDITARKRVEKALQKAHDELERRVKERTRDLEIKTNSLEEINTALEVLLRKREEDKTELESNVLTNVKELVVPYFEKIKKTKLDNQQEAFLSIIESNLNEIISPFIREISLKYLKLTPTEIQIANLVRHGSTTKDIAEILNVSPRTVETHRKNIRRKIGLEGKKANLRSHLLSLH